MSFDPHVLHSADQLKALAHPLRMAILERLMVYGAATASELGAALDETPANCSWHLRKLAEYGYVEETGDGTGRRRPWRATKIGFTFSDESLEGPAARAAARTMTDLMVRRNVERHLARWDGEPWSFLGPGTAVVWATEAEARALIDDLSAVVRPYHDRLADPSLRPAGARAVNLMLLSDADPMAGPGEAPDGAERPETAR